ncbi:hypothetical protein PV325_013495 [Microctonus aethiopoides]|nr:hypothetical protein PV325_013495 [Microctonus aethiopoides]
MELLLEILEDFDKFKSELCSTYVSVSITSVQEFLAQQRVITYGSGPEVFLNSDRQSSTLKKVSSETTRGWLDGRASSIGRRRQRQRSCRRIIHLYKDVDNVNGGRRREEAPVKRKRPETLNE